ncbi:hypothetical protein KFL_002920050 [Klebsormidium nitens]|uniref:Glycosyltransferase 2-like domain-containing protein n=1 Tax=Klebsormidium nitens TaxID=105231 RepID=A0A1Y1IEG4_KLENI|nr:hypothetical protein KFL_002920050 [Klebsormidium nitens]|eukprot:GAQ86488.1 hypothetical protein KFL_002920050 [Klebsormidium nitens]
MNLSPTLQRSPSLRRTTSSLRGLQRRTNWTLVVVVLTVLHLSATFLYYTFLAGTGEVKQGGTPKKVAINYDAEVALLREELAQSQEALREERLARHTLLATDPGGRRGHQEIEIVFPLGPGALETKTNGVLPDRTRDPLQPLISVIISARKQGGTISDAIQSVFAQTYPHWELILVDDNSADDTAARCREALTKHTQHPVTFIRKGSTGIVDGLNRGLELARGDWIVALAPTDRLAPGYFADVAEGAAADFRAQIFLGCMELETGKQRTWCFPDGWSLSGLTQPSDLPLGFAVRRDLVSDVGGFDPACPEQIHHWNFWLSALRYRPKVRFLPKVVLFHASGEASDALSADGHEGYVSAVERAEAAAMVRTLHPDVFEPSQLLADHETLAFMSTETLTGVLSRCYQFPGHPVLPFWKGLYWEAQGEHVQAVELVTESLRAAQNGTRFADRWQQHFWLALFHEANGSLMAALTHARLALTFNHFDELLRALSRLEIQVNGLKPGVSGAHLLPVPYYWSNEEEVERIRQRSLSGKLGRLAELEAGLGRTRRKHVELVALLETLRDHPCQQKQGPRGPFNLVRNPHFDGRREWFNFGLGFDIDPANGRSGNVKEEQPALSLQSFRLDEQRGAMQSVTVDQRVAGPILISAWHKGQGVVGPADEGLGLLLEVHYQNGSDVLQSMVHFAPGTHDWEDVSAVVSGGAPIASIDVTILFVGHSGQLWVDDVGVVELRKAACLCPPNTFYDPTPARECSPCPEEHVCVHGFKVERDVGM